MRWVWLVAVAACGGNAQPAGTAEVSSAKSDWHPSETTRAVHIDIDRRSTLHDAQLKIIHDACQDAVLVWGDVRVEPGTRAVEVAVGGTTLRGFLVCESGIEEFLKAQLGNPRLKPGHGGSADLQWRDGQLYMHRRWSAAQIPLGKLSPPPSDVFQKDEALAAIFTCEDAAAPVTDVFDALSRVPKVFLFGMYVLRF